MDNFKDINMDLLENCNLFSTNTFAFLIPNLKLIKVVYLLVFQYNNDEWVRANLQVIICNSNSSYYGGRTIYTVTHNSTIVYDNNQVIIVLNILRLPSSQFHIDIDPFLMQESFIFLPFDLSIELKLVELEFFFISIF